MQLCFAPKHGLSVIVHLNYLQIPGSLVNGPRIISENPLVQIKLKLDWDPLPTESAQPVNVLEKNSNCFHILGC